MKFLYRAIFFALVSTLTACLTGSGSSGTSNGNATFILEITSALGASRIDTNDQTISLTGIAESPVGIAKVSWTNNRGGFGLATGTSSWNVASIALEFGINSIIVTAEDINGNATSRSIAVFRESGQPGTVTLFWTTPTTRTDGTALMDLAGFNIYFGRMSGIYDYQIDINNPGVVAYVVENLASGSWYFSITAFDANGVESEQSNEIIQSVM